MKKTVFIFSLIVSFVFTACSNDDSTTPVMNPEVIDDENEEETEDEARVNEIIINTETFPTDYVHTFVYGDNEIGIIISNNDQEDWGSYEGDIQFIDFTLYKSELEGTYTFLNVDDDDFDANSHFSYVFSAITTMEDGEINDTNEAGDGPLETWYDTDGEENVVNSSSLEINNLGESEYEIDRKSVV